MTERSAFETWATASPEGFLLSMDRSESPFASCCAYSSGRTETAWLAWQASRQQALESAAAAMYGVIELDIAPREAAVSAIRSLSSPIGDKA